MNYDRNNIPYTEERIENFIDADPDEIYLTQPSVNLTIRKYPKRYLIACEVDEALDLPYDPCDGEEASRCYILPKVYLWPWRYLHDEFELQREQILAEIKSKLQKLYLKS